MGGPPSQAINDQSLILQQSTAPLQLFRKKNVWFEIHWLALNILCTIHVYYRLKPKQKKQRKDLQWQKKCFQLSQMMLWQNM